MKKVICMFCIILLPLGCEDIIDEVSNPQWVFCDPNTSSSDIVGFECAASKPGRVRLPLPPDFHDSLRNDTDYQSRICLDSPFNSRLCER